MSFPTFAARMLAFALPFAFVAGAAQAQSEHHGAHGAPAAGASAGSTSGSAKTPVTESPFQKDMASSMDRMHKDMMDPAKMTGNADHDFMVMMIPHHQGAIEMAESVLKHGKDPKVKALAREIIAAQKKEITQMRAWIAKSGAGK